MDNQEKKETSTTQSESSESIDYSQLRPPEPMGGKASSQSSGYQSAPQANPPVSGQAPQKDQIQVEMEQGPEKSSFASYLLMLFLAIIIILGILVFVSWKGWISLGGIEKLWTGEKTPQPTATPQASPSFISPSITTSPKIISNVNDQVRKNDLQNLKSALLQYYQDNNYFPLTTATIKTSEPESVLAQGLVPQYLQQLPDDPLTPQYYYGYQSNGQTFELSCVLEDRSDPSGLTIGQYYIYKITNITEE